MLVGDAFDTRPFRLPWPEGTVIFCCAPAAAHAAAEAAFKAQGARVPRGCLLRRVPVELAELGEPEGVDFGLVTALERAGFRGDRLSAWVLQVGRCYFLEALGGRGLRVLVALCVPGQWLRCESGGHAYRTSRHVAHFHPVPASQCTRRRSYHSALVGALVLPFRPFLTCFGTLASCDIHVPANLPPLLPLPACRRGWPATVWGQRA